MSILPYAFQSKIHGLRFRLTRKLPLRHPAEVWPGIESVQITVKPFSGEFGNVQRYELMILCAAVKHFGARRLVEIGTFDGLTAWHLAANSVQDARLWTVDLPLDHPARFKDGHDRSIGKIQGIAVGRQFADTPEAAKIEQVFQDSTTFKPEALRGQVDFCFIDGGHMHETVSRDTDNALAMVTAGGLTPWHDYSRWWPGVQRCLDELAQRLPVFRVAETNLAAVQLPR